MATDEVYQFTISTPAGTLASAPQVTPTQFPSRIVRRVEWRVPAGSMGVMGWQFSMRGVPVLPRNVNSFIIAHELANGYDLDNLPDSGDWSVNTYNTGGFAHLLYVTFHCVVIRHTAPELVLADGFGLSESPDPGYTGV